MFEPNPAFSLSGLPPALHPAQRLYILVGDSIDREVVRSRCGAPVQYDVRRCLKCLVCANASDGATWVNVMHFGVGVGGSQCTHVDSHWAEAEAVRESVARMHLLLGSLLSSAAAATFGEVTVQLSSGTWDMLSTKECPHLAPALHAGGAWTIAARRLVHAAIDVVSRVAASVPLQAHPRVLWRTLPLVCRTLKGGEEIGRLMSGLSSHGARLACEEGLDVVDWRGVSCERGSSLADLVDGVHWRDASYDWFAQATATEASRRSSDGGRPVGSCDATALPPPPSVNSCECRVCGVGSVGGASNHYKLPEFSWSLGVSPSMERMCLGAAAKLAATANSTAAAAASAASAAASASAASAAASASAASAAAATSAAAAASTPTIGRSSRTSSATPSATPASSCALLDALEPPSLEQTLPLVLFTLAIYDDTAAALPWLGPSLRGFEGNAGLLDVYILTPNELRAALRPPSRTLPRNVRRLLVPRLMTELVRFAGIATPAATSSAASSATVKKVSTVFPRGRTLLHPPPKLSPSRPLRPSSFTPLLPHFAESRCACLASTIDRYSFVGTVELDVVLGHLAPFVIPYFGDLTVDAVGLRWSRCVCACSP